MKNLEKVFKIFLKNKSVKIDSRKIEFGDIFFAISGENFNANSFVQEALERGAALAVLDDKEFFDVSDKRMILAESSLELLQELAKKYRQELDIPFLAITGSNGKTTTKELTREVLSQKYSVLATEGNLNNHIGVPLTILSIKPKNNFAIIEMGANHVGEIKNLCEIVKPNFGIVTNISKAHIGEFGNFENIVKTKMALYDFLDENFGHKFDNCQAVKILDDSFFLKVEIFGREVKTNLVGDYNSKNIGAAVKIGEYFGVEKEMIIESISKYRPKNNRSQFLMTDKKNNVILDAYNANPESMKLSLESFFKKNLENKVLIIGDMKELGKYSFQEHRNILELIKSNGLRSVYLIGKEFLVFKDSYGFNFFEEKKDFMSYLKENLIENKIILIKASRGIGLEEIVDKKLI